MNLPERLQALMTKKEMTQYSLAAVSGVPQPTIQRILTGKSKDPRRSNIEKIANPLDTTAEYLLTGKQEPIFNNKVIELYKTHPNTIEINIFDSVPVVSWVAAGNWEDVADPYEPGSSDSWLPCPKKHGERTFALRVDGVSMENLGGKYSYSDGDIIFVDPSIRPENGSRVVVRLEGEKQATFKQLIIEGGKKYLKPLNPSWPDKIIPINGNATICGVVIGKWVEE